MEEALLEKQKHNVENLQTGAAFSQVELRMKELVAEKDVSMHMRVGLWSHIWLPG